MAAPLIRKLVARAGDRPARLALRISNIPPIRHILGQRYARALEKHRVKLPVLAGLDLTIVQALNDTGMFVTSLEELGIAGSVAMLRTAQRAGDRAAKWARSAADEGRAFTAVAPDDIAAYPTLFEWGVNERLLDIVEAYIGLPVAYDGLALIYTVADGREVATRAWHRDREDRKMVKVAVYCNDVTEGGGPFQVIARLDPRHGDAGGYGYEGGGPDELASRLGADYARDIVTCPGKAGTVIFVDTARYFHRGEPVRTEDRKAVFFSYFARATRHPFFCARSGLTRQQLDAMSCMMTERQRASILWQDELPAWVKIIPPAPV